MSIRRGLISTSFVVALLVSGGCGGPQAPAAPAVGGARTTKPEARTQRGASAGEAIISDGEGDGDRDGDRILDKLDACVLQAEDRDGYLDADGCPELDNDADGLADANDRDPVGWSCANDPEDLDGFEDADGCPDPDNDKDTFVDLADFCPMEPGPSTGPQIGCPKKPSRVWVGDEVNILRQVQFEPGKYNIKPGSVPILDEVADVLTNYPRMRVEIQGHTDGRVGAGEVKRLGERRAEEVKSFLVRKGIDASRMNVCGYGGERPIADRTDRGRMLNRRVQFITITTEPACSARTPGWSPP